MNHVSHSMQVFLVLVISNWEFTHSNNLYLVFFVTHNDSMFYKENTLIKLITLS